MVASIINKMSAERVRDRADEAARGIVVYFPGVTCLGPELPIEQARKRLEALELFPWMPPAGNA